MAHLRDRRAFGNIGTRKFRGARFGDPLSPRGPQYTLEGRVLDYSTDVGPFTIVDKSGESNTATLYSGRGLTMDGVGDLIDFGSPTFSEPVTSMTGYARSTDTSIDLGLTSATLAGNDTWETFSADTAAKDYGDAQWFNGVDTYVALGTLASIATYTEISVSLSFIATGDSSRIFSMQHSGGDDLRINFDVSGNLRVAVDDGTAYTLDFGTGYNDGNVHSVTMTLDGSGLSATVDGSTTMTDAGATFNFSTAAGIAAIASNGGNLGTNLMAGSVFGLSISNQSGVQHSYTGLSPTPWEDTIGSNDGTVSGVDQTAAQYFTNPDFILGTGYNGDLSDVRCLGATGTVLGHWSLADWSNPSGNTSNGKTVVDSGANQLHGTCTGCSGFTGEGIDPLFVPITDETLPYFAGDNAGSVGFSDVTFAGDLAVSFKTHIIDLDGTSGTIDGAHFLADNGGSARIYFDGSVAGGGAVAIADGAGNTSVWQSESALVAGVDYDIQITRISGVWNLTINGVDKATPSVNNASGTLTLNSWGSKRGAATSITALDGVIYDINLGSAAWGGGTPYTDTIGSNDGTPSGTFLTVGQKRATIPQTADKNWNKYTTLTHESDTGFTVNSSSFPEGDLDLSLTSGTGFYFMNTPAGAIGDVVRVMGDIVITNGSPNFALRPTSTTSVVSNAVIISASGSFDFELTATNTFGRLAISEADVPANYVISNLRVIMPDGNALISASDANIQIDALGTAILEPRLNTQQLNLFGEGEYSSTPDSASLDLTTAATWEIWGNFYGASGAEALLSKFGLTSERSFSLYTLNTNAVRLHSTSDGTSSTNRLDDVSVPDAVVHLAFTYEAGVGIIGYVNGISVAVTVTGTLPASLYVGTADAQIGAWEPTAPVAFASRQIGSAKIYNVALTADEVLTNYNTQKSLYGL